MSEPTGRSFVDACLAGEALDLDVDDWIDRWSDSDGAPEGHPLALSEFLGMSPQEYTYWVEEPSTLRVIIASHRRGQSIEELLRTRGHFDLAARSGTDREAVRSLVEWLVERGDLPGSALAALPA